MRKVAMVITRMVPGGASKIVKQIIEAGKYDFTLFTGQEDIDHKVIENLKSECDVKIITSMVRRISPLSDYKAYRQLLGEFRKNEFDIVHTHTSKAGFIGRLAAAKAGVGKIIHTPHGTIYRQGSNIDGVPTFSLGLKMLQIAERYAGGKTDILTALSENEKQICIRLGLSREDNTAVIYNGVKCADYEVSNQDRNKARESFGFSNKDIIVLSIGRLSSEKGHTTLLDAFAKAYLDNSNLKLMIIGDGPEKSDLQQRVNYHNLNDQVILPGHSDKVHQYLAAADIFVLPSLYEGFGIVAVEAMVAGLPVIVSDVGGLPEIISNEVEGFLVPPGNIDRLSEKIVLLIKNNELREKMGEAGKQRAKEFTLEKMLGKYQKLYG